MPERMRSLATAGRRTLRTDKGTLLVSLLMGTLIWVYVDSRRTEEATLEVSLLCQAPAGWLLTGAEDRPETISVRVYGPANTVDGLRDEELRLVRSVAVPSGSPDEVERSVELRSLDLEGLPSDVSVLHIDPPRVTVHLVQLMKTYLPVQASLEGTPDPGYTVHTVLLDPMRLPVEAPKGILDPSDVLETKPISVAGARSAVSQMVELRPFAKKEVRLPPRQSVYATVEIKEKKATRVLDDIPIHLLLAPPLRLATPPELDPLKVRVTIEGSTRILSTLRPLDVTVFADERERVPQDKGTFAAPLRSLVPQGLRMVSIEPKDVIWKEPSPPPPATTASAASPAKPANESAAKDASKTPPPAKAIPSATTEKAAAKKDTP